MYAGAHKSPETGLSPSRSKAWCCMLMAEGLRGPRGDAEADFRVPTALEDTGSRGAQPILAG